MTDYLLSDLVEYRTQVLGFDLDRIHQDARYEIDQLLHILMQHHKIRFKKRHQHWEATSSQIDSAFDALKYHVGDLILHIENLVRQLEHEYLVASLHWFQNEMCHETNDYRLSRTLPISANDHELLMGRIYRWTDWHVPGIILGPKTESHIDAMVSLDPLYLIDQHEDLLLPAVTRFNPQYQRRLRTYVVTEKLGQAFLAQLPDEQFGFCFAYNYFNFKPMEVIAQYLHELYQKMRPGASLLMTFNDCDQPHGVRLCERHFACYTPATMVRKEAAKIGFVVNHEHRGDMDVTWIEFGKPGKIRSIRGGQTLAKVVAASK